MFKKIIPLLITIALLFCFCKKNKNTAPEEEKTPFDKQGMLVNMADNIVLANYNAFNNYLDSLIISYDTFKANPTALNIQTVKYRLNQAYLKYQLISLYEFGPAEQEIVRMNFNVFPTDTAQIKANIISGSYNLAAASNLDAKGFPALDYIFYEPNKTELQVANSFTALANKKQYVTDVLNDMKTKITNIINAWNATYRNQFVNSLSTDIGSSIGFLVNQLNYELDYLKNAKIGIPLGKKSLDIVLPDKCEAYYGQQSTQYAIATLGIIESIYLGKSFIGNDGKGFDDYLDHLNAQDGTLNSKIKNQFAVCYTKLYAITGGSLASQISTNHSVVNAAYIELVKLLVLLKTDMPSSLGVVITYQDGDGD